MSNELELAFTLFIPGKVITQGSKGVTRDGRMFDVNSGDLRKWRRAIATAAKATINGLPYWELEVPLAVSSTAWIERPANTDLRFPVRQGDIDKFERALYDGLTDGAVWKDDGWCVEGRMRKVWTDGHQPRPGLSVSVYRVL